MGIASNLRSAFGYGPRLDVLASPFTDAQLNTIVWSEIFGVANAPMTRREAMSIPSLSKARNLICATVAKLPLKAADRAGLLADDAQPSWTYRTDGNVGPFSRMLWTLDDLLFNSRSLWATERDFDGLLLGAERVPYELWEVTPEGGINIEGVPVQNALDVIYFDGPIEGLLDKDASSLRSAKAISAAVESRAKSPIPIMEIHALGGDEPTAAEAKALVTEYNKARRDPEGATVYTPSSVELRAHGDKADSGAMVEGRNAVRLDVANMTGVPAALLDGSVSQSSLTYSTQQGRRNEFVDYGLTLWMESIAGRLSQDDIVPAGQHVVFDQTDFLTTLPSPTGLPSQD